MEDKSSTDSMHKEEKKCRILHDQVGWDILRLKLEVFIDIFDASHHGDELVNVVTGKINSSIRLGEDQMENFQKKSLRWILWYYKWEGEGYGRL